MKDTTFFIPYRFPGLNEVTSANRSHWSKGAKQKKEATEVAEFYAKKDGTKFDKPVEICFYYIEPPSSYNTRLRDPDNIVSAKKFILDGLVNAGMIPNDTQKWIKKFGQDDWGIKDKGEKVGVWVQVVEYDIKQFNSRPNTLGPNN